MNNKEYQRKLKKVKAKVLELVIEDFSGCWTKDDASALGYAVKFTQNLILHDDGTIEYSTGTNLNSNSKWSGLHTLDRIIQDYNTKVRG